MSGGYLPIIAEVTGVRAETPPGDRAIKTLRVQSDGRAPFAHRPGQCAMVSAFGRGEAMISIACPPNGEYLEFSVLLQGQVTTGLQYLEAGEKIALRGPYGNSFPVERWRGKRILVTGGGIGIAPLRSVYGYILQHRSDFAGLDIFYGARSSEYLIYRQEFFDMMRSGAANVYLSIDRPEPGWSHFVGFVVANLLRVAPPPENTVAITCGPPIHIKVTLEALKKLGFADDQIYTTLERKMKCGIGKCGRCNIGHIYTCTKGPVFSYAEIKELPPEGLPDR
ncbi:MAG: FAD/NAD(P)-binding protein [Thermoplasmatota archaeon]